MAKFCGNCGTQLDDNAKICGNCGTPLTSAKTTNASIPGVGDDPEKKEKAKKKMTMFLGIAAVLSVVIIALSAIISSSGYKGTVRKIMNAYKDYDVDKIVSMSSGLYDSAGKLLSADNYFGDIISDDLESFESQVGPKYKLSYEITDSYEMPKYKYESLMDTLSYYSDFDADSISKVMVVKVNVTAKKNKDSMTKKLELQLTKENGSWKLLDMN